MPIPSNVIDKDLYNEVKAKIKAKMPKSSAYRSGLIVKEYKKRGGRYSGKKTTKGLSQWFRQEWINMYQYSKNGKIVKCSEKNKDTSACRPLKKVGKTLTADEVISKHGRQKVIDISTEKKKNMNKTINWSKGTIK